MKNILRNGLIFTMLSLAVVSCRDTNNEADDVDDLTTDSNTEVRVSNDGDKVKIKTDDKKVKIEVNDDGSVEKKVKIDN
tara:strand:- start:120856 stop:121092 length:237 start_codon:yes stop_codon:yes gene_type:complete